MKLKFIKADDNERNIKATIHSTGKLGFSDEAAKSLSLTAEKTISFAQNEEDPNDENLYAIIHDGPQEGAFKIYKAGQYYSVSTKKMFDKMDVDYVKYRVIFDMIETEFEGQRIIKMKRRMIKRKKEEKSTE